MNVIDVIRAKRDGARLTDQQIDWVIRAYTDGVVADEQMSALAMAILLNGMDRAEINRWTDAMIGTGIRMDFSGLDRPTADKHSTGGVGDGVSLLLAPLLAACGGYVPMISGRGLGHTGGTLDKLESVAGYDVHPSTARLRQVVEEVGCAIVGQGDELVPADRRLYAVRDVTATVDVADLMVASILSKKLAGGARALLLDIKTGNGAQLPEMAAARALAGRMLAVAEGSGLDLRVVYSDMDQLLGREAGNALELRAALELLCGRGNNPRLLALTLELGAALLGAGGLADDRSDAERQLRRALDSGAAAERFARMVAALGGPADLLQRMDIHLASAPIQREVRSPDSGYVVAVDVRTLGQAVVELGGGRSRPGQALDHAVGLAEVLGCGSAVEVGQPLAIIHARSADAAEAVQRKVARAFRITTEPPPSRPLWQWHLPAEQFA